MLDGTTATVFELLEQGAAPDAIESKLDAQQTVAPGAELLALALDELAKARLLEGEATKSVPVMEGRRQMLQKLAGVGAALLIPAIVTLTPNSAYAQGSQLANGASCSSNSGRCASGCCCSTANTCRSSSSCTNGGGTCF